MRVLIRISTNRSCPLPNKPFSPSTNELPLPSLLSQYLLTRGCIGTLRRLLHSNTLTFPPHHSHRLNLLLSVTVGTKMGRRGGRNRKARHGNRARNRDASPTVGRWSCRPVERDGSGRMLGGSKRVDLVPTVEEQERKQHRDADGVHRDHDPGIGLSPYT